jgi:hypothetical protein
MRATNGRWLLAGRECDDVYAAGYDGAERVGDIVGSGGEQQSDQSDVECGDGQRRGDGGTG